MTNLVAAVDGGQTSTLALIADDSGRILGVGTAGESNHIHEPGGLERMEKALRTSIGGALASANAVSQQVTHACLGMTGGKDTARELTQQILPNADVQSHDDMVTALFGASTGQPGVIVIAGTGAVAYGQTADGRWAKADGWGYLMGDEGSAYDIGCQALRAATAGLDGRSMSTSLVEKIAQSFQCDDLYGVHRLVYAQQISRAQIAGLAAVVTEAAREGDKAAITLLQHAGEALGASALALLARLNAREADMQVYITGGVFRAGELVLAPFRDLIERSSNARVHPAAFSPVVGALLMALKAAHVALTPDLISTVRESLPDAAISKVSE